MDEEREKGRIAGLRTRRLATAAWASTLIPVLDQARKELPDQDGGGPALLAYARWLNQRDYKTRRRKTWRAETVSRLFEIHISLIEEAEKEFKLASAVIDSKLQYAKPQDREALVAERTNIENERVYSIIEARKLVADLKGQSYVDEPVPPPISPRLRKAAPKRAHRIPAESQLKLI